MAGEAVPVDYRRLRLKSNWIFGGQDLDSRRAEEITTRSPYELGRNMLASLTKSGFLYDATPAELRSARENFERHDYLRITRFIEPSLLRLIQRYLRKDAFESRQHPVGRELRLSDNAVAGVVLMLMNDPKLFRLIRGITGCGAVGSFTGRFYRMTVRGQEFHWHNDMQDFRMVAISVNVSNARYRGGMLQIRNGAGSALRSIPNLGFGDAIIFPVGEHLEHRVTPVTGKSSKTAYSGWFCSRPKYRWMHREMVGLSESEIGSHFGGGLRRLAFPSRDAVKIPNAVVSQRNGGETFVANITTGTYYSLNESGGRVWELMRERGTIRSIASAIAAEYAAPSGEIERDVLALANDLARRDLVRIVRAPRS